MTTSSGCALKRLAATIIRVSFGFTILLVGMAWYIQFDSFSIQVVDGLGPLSFFGAIWAYLLPGLMIFGGALFVSGILKDIAVWVTGVAIGSIPPGMVLKTVLSDISLDDNLPWAFNMCLWLMMFYIAAKSLSADSCNTAAAPEKAEKPKAAKK